MWQNHHVPIELDVHEAPSSKPLGATSEANEPVIRPAAYSFSKDAQMTSTTTAIDQKAAPVADVVAPGGQSRPQTIREFERSLRTLGFSQRESTSIAKGGFKAIGNDEHEHLSEMARLIEINTSILKANT